ncbi:MAG: Hsp20/alpha crystallin family protein [Desulfobacterales bacterium]|nr:MAG: Hsp20/alpha crystallin family protein [Desulfobacterales bacterium]
MFDMLPWKRKKENHANELRREIDNMYDRFFEPNFLPSSYLFGKGKWDPTVDISEGRKDITVKAEIPGIEAKDFDISIDGRLLTIRGEKKQEQKEKEETYYRVERSYGYFNRTIELPAEVDPDKVDASYKRGILKIKLRKAKDYETKRIKVTTG